MQVLNVTRWPLVFVILGAAGAAIVLAFSSFNLFMFAMANFASIEREGWEAIRHGALWQLGELGSAAPSRWQAGLASSFSRAS
ncbi:MAG: hypothetical protein R3D46_16675 [Defluviimonas denitrificans]